MSQKTDIAKAHTIEKPTLANRLVAIAADNGNFLKE